MEKLSTNFLKAAIILLALPVLALGLRGLLGLFNHPAHPDYAWILYPIVIVLYLSVIPYFTALYQAFKLVTYIEQYISFSELSNQALKKIKWCAMTISGLYLLIMPFIYHLAQMDDAPGLVLMGFLPVFASLIITVFAAVLQRILREAIQFKTENELTV